MPALTSRADSASDDSSDDNDNNNDDSNDVDQLLEQRRDNTDDANNTDKDNNDTDNEEVVSGHTDTNDWKRISKEKPRAGWCIGPIPYTPCVGDGEFFDVKISDEDLKGLIEKNGTCASIKCTNGLYQNLARGAIVNG